MTHILHLTVPDGPVVKTLESDLLELSNICGGMDLVGVRFDRGPDGVPRRLLTFRIMFQDRSASYMVAERYADYQSDPCDPGQNCGKFRLAVVSGAAAMLSFLENAAPAMVI